MPLEYGGTSRSLFGAPAIATFAITARSAIISDQHLPYIPTALNICVVVLNKPLSLRRCRNSGQRPDDAARFSRMQDTALPLPENVYSPLSFTPHYLARCARNRYQSPYFICDRMIFISLRRSRIFGFKHQARQFLLVRMCNL